MINAISNKVLKNSFRSHARERGHPKRLENSWIPTCAGMTKRSIIRVFQPPAKYFLIVCSQWQLFRLNKLVQMALLACCVNGWAQGQDDSLRFRVRLFSEGPPAAAQLEHAAGFTAATPLRPEAIAQGLQHLWEYLRAQRYYAVHIDSVLTFAPTPAGTPTMQFYLHTGPQTRLRLTAQTRDSSLISKNALRELAGEHDELAWQQRLLQVLYDCARQGYPLASFQLDSVREENAGNRQVANMFFALDPGPLVTVDSIIIRGNKLTQARTLLRELPVQPGDKFDLDRVDEIPAVLMRLGFLQEVAAPSLLTDARGRYLLLIEVKEGNSNFLNGVAGYNPAAGSQKGYVTGLIDVQFGNLFGTGRSFHARWEKRGVETQELALRYREPWFLNYPVHISGGFQQLIQDTLYVERQWDVTVELPFAQRFTVLGALTRESVSPDSLAALRLNLPSSRVTNLQAGWRYDSRNDLLNPERGLLFATTLAAGFKHVDTSTVSQRFTRQKVTVDFHVLLPMFWPQVLSLAVHGRQVTSDEAYVSITDQIRFGGATTLRGYREDELRGSRVAWSNLEYRYLLSPRSRAFVFCDIGYYFRDEPPPGGTVNVVTDDTKSAFGLGVRLDSPVGVVGLDYGVASGGDWLNGKVHVSLVNSF